MVEIWELLNSSKHIKLTLSERVKDAVEKFGVERFKEGISLLGLGGSEISIDEIISGFSGVLVGKAGVYGYNDSRGPIRSYWLLKWGEHIIKLVEESQAHRRMFQRGIERSLQIPQLHPNVVCWEGLGFIAYGFEEKAKTALELINSQGVQSLVPLLNKINICLYADSRKIPVLPQEQLMKWCKFDNRNRKILSDDLMTHPLEVTGALIHGDFHLRNILIKENSPTLIDFAKSDLGPISIDLAKLIIDILVFLKEIQFKSDLMKWESLMSTPLSGILGTFERYLNAPDDKKFFEIALWAYISAYLNYPDVAQELKLVIEEALKKLHVTASQK
ncbi:MAG: phosphotransferase [Nitrospirota bacterium]